MTAVAFVFPGQGSQSLGMMSSFADMPLVRSLFEEASDCYQEDLWALSQHGPEEKLHNTYYTQVLMFVADVAMAMLWADRGGLVPRCLAGHSLGEYAALVCAGIYPFSEVLCLVKKRAQAMGSVSDQNLGMMAVLAKANQVDELMARVLASSTTGRIELANLNSPSQYVISGARELLIQCQAEARSLGIKRCIMLPVSSAFHSSYMAEAAEEMRRFLDAQELSFVLPTIPVLHNYGVCSYQTEEALKAALVAQITHPVPWVQTLETMAQSGITHVIEMGPGTVLTGLTKKTVPELSAISFSHYDDFDEKIAMLNSTGGSLV